MHLQRRDKYRNSIRRQQIDEYKKSKRIMMITSLIQHQQTRERHLCILHQFTLEQLQLHTNNCLQLLKEVIFSSHSHSHQYKQHYSSVLQTLTLYIKSMGQNFGLLLNSQVRVDLMLQVIGGIYYQLPSTTLLPITGEIIKVMVALIRESFRNQQNAYSQMLSCRQNALRALWNVTCSEDEEITSIILRSCLFEQIEEGMQTYGVTSMDKQAISGILSNSIQAILYKGKNNNTSNNTSQTNSVPDWFASVYGGLCQSIDPQTMANTIVISISVLKKIGDNMETNTNETNTNETLMDALNVLLHNISISDAPQAMDNLADLFMCLHHCQIHSHAAVTSIIEKIILYANSSQNGKHINTMLKGCIEWVMIMQQRDTSQQCIVLEMGQELIKYWERGDIPEECSGEFIKWIRATTMVPTLFQLIILRQSYLQLLKYGLTNEEVLLNIHPKIILQLIGFTLSYIHSNQCGSKEEWSNVMQAVEGLSYSKYSQGDIQQMCDAIHHQIHTLLQQ